MVDNESGNIICSKEEHTQKDLSPIVVTELGIDMH